MIQIESFNGAGPISPHQTIRLGDHEVHGILLRHFNAVRGALVQGMFKFCRRTSRRASTAATATGKGHGATVDAG